MPIPKPTKQETKKQFIDRCMSSETMNNEYPKQEQRAAICYTKWREKGNK